MNEMLLSMISAALTFRILILPGPENCNASRMARVADSDEFV